ncbi:hypothetical protein NDU88_005454 [Pleurodeles waltl]|uniref:Uncharacterized protein n=1 Tax=Pleurodeles waltl TaxID=8319 RepID=A0AAV7VJ16_PLEWA|nr:hypothetical protein NDU88_005454 [Pleurodeles waltl]
MEKAATRSNVPTPAPWHNHHAKQQYGQQKAQKLVSGTHPMNTPTAEPRSTPLAHAQHQACSEEEVRQAPGFLITPQGSQLPSWLGASQSRPQQPDTRQQQTTLEQNPQLPSGESVTKQPPAPCHPTTSEPQRALTLAS